MADFENIPYSVVYILAGASVCDNLNNNKTACCAQLDAKDNKTNVCQFVLCNGTGGKITSSCLY